MPAEVLQEVVQVLALYLMAVVGLSLWLYKSGSDLDKKINELMKKR